MVFAGHIKSRDLFEGTSDAARASPTALAIKAEKAALQEEVRRKELELQRLRAATYATDTSTVVGARHVLQNSDPGSQFDDHAANARLVDDRGNIPSRSLWVGNTPHDIRTSDLRAKFGRYGPILSTKCLTDCCFVNFVDEHSAIKAWKECHEKELFEQGRHLYIRFTNTHIESKRSKDAQFERTSSLHQPAHYSLAEAFQRMPVTKTSDTSAAAGGKKISEEWPNGSPPVGPKSQRYPISPSSLIRTSSHRWSDQRHPDVLRPDLKRTARSSEDTKSFQERDSDLDKPNTENNVMIRDRGGLCPKTNLMHNESPDKAAAQSARGQPENTNSQMETKSVARHHATLIAEAKAKLLQKASTSAISEQAQTSALKASSSSAAPVSLATMVRKDTERTDVTLLDKTQPSTNLPPSLTNIIEQAEIESGAVAVAMSSNSAKYWEHQPTVQLLAYPPSLLNSIHKSSPIMPANKRLRLDRDEVASMRSGRSSLSNSSSRDRRCRGCKKLGNEKGLHILYKCASCTRRYHAYCGCPRPDQSEDPTKFVCEKCRRTQNHDLRHTESDISMNTGTVLQLASPPLSHDNCDSEHGTSSKLTSHKLFDPATVSADFSIDAPLTPDAVSLEDGTGMTNHDIFSKSILATQVKRVSKPCLPLHDGAADEASLPSTESFAQKKYNCVTCPWWKKGGRCRLREEDCLYSHTDTGIQSPNGFKSNHDWTCYFWLQEIACPEGEKSCRYSHHDTGLHTWKDGRASLKHVTCFWWATRGVCKHEEKDCRYAHFDTGLYSPDPSDKRAGMAVSIVRPLSNLSVSTQINGHKGMEFGIEEARKPNKGPAIAGDLSNSIDADKERSGEPSLGAQTTYKSSNDRAAHQKAMSPVQPNLMPISDSNIEQCHRKRKHDDLTDPAQDAVWNQSETQHNGTVRTKRDSIDLSTISNGQASSFHNHKRLFVDVSYSSNSKTLGMLNMSAAIENSTTAVPTKDPRKSLLKSLRTLHQDTEWFTKVAATSGIHKSVGEARDSPKPSPTTLEPQLNNELDITTPVNQSYKKCEQCAKSVISSKQYCRDCSRGQVAFPGLAESSDQKSENPSRTSNEMRTTETDPDDIAKVVESDLHMTPRQEVNMKLRSISKPPLKRALACDDMFISRKRPRTRQTISFATDSQKPLSTGENFKKTEPQSMHERIEQLRQEKRRKSEEALRATIRIQRQVNERNAVQSDKENETPITEDEHSPLSTTSTNEHIRQPDDGMICDSHSMTSTRQSSPQAGSVGAELRTRSESKTVANASIPDIFDENDSVPLFSNMSYANCTDDADDMPLVRDRATENSHTSESTTKVQCAQCVRRHIRCFHKHDEPPGRIPEVEPSRRPTLDSDRHNLLNRTLGDGPSWSRINPTDRLTFSACESCRNRHRKCLHTPCGDQLDPFKCQQYLEVYRDKKDTSRSNSEWDAIVGAALSQHENVSEISDQDTENSTSDTDEESLSFPLDSVDEAPASSDTDTDTRCSDKNVPLIPSRGPVKSQSNRPAAIVTDSVGLTDDTGIYDRVVAMSQRKVNAKYTYDDEHMIKLMSEGIKFEEDEDEDDYLSDDDDFSMAITRWVVDPLRVPPKSSRDLYEICPELHPENVRQTNSTNEARRKQPQISRKNGKQLQEERFKERIRLYGNPHWEVCRRLPQQRISTLVEQFVPGREEELAKFPFSCVERNEVFITFQEFLGAPQQPEACLAADGALAFRDGAKDIDQTSFVRSARGLGRRALDEDKFPVNER